MIFITPRVAIDEAEVEERFVRASGPGGQNVNKVATAVQLRFDLGASTSLPRDVRDRLRRLAGSRMTIDDVLIIDARRFRTQERNRRDAMERLVELVRQAAHAPTPRRPTKPTRASNRRRLETKHHRATLKRQRRVDPHLDS